jgi:cold shock CspA family protein
MRGKLKKWVADRGFGFLEIDDTGKDVFVHIRVIQNAQFSEHSEPHVGSLAEFDVITSTDGRPRAVNVKLLDEGDE